MRNSIISVNLDKRTNYREMRYKQFDTGHKVTLKVIQGGKSFMLDDYLPIAFFKLPNKPLEQRSCIVEGNIITIELDNYLLSESGIIPFEVELRKDEEITTTFRMQYYVEESFDTDGAITSEPNWEIFGRLLEIDMTNYVTYSALEQMFNDADTGLTVDLTTYQKKSELKTVATSGDYEDLEGKPTKLSEFENDLVEGTKDASEVIFTDGDSLQEKFDTHQLGSGGAGGTTVISGGSGYGVIIKDNTTDDMLTANNANEVLNLESEGLSEVQLIPKATTNGKDTVKITTRFPTWEEVAGDPLTIFNSKEFIFENDTIGINTANIGGGGSGGGLPFINVKNFKVWEKNPTTGVLEEVSYGAKGDNTSPDMDTKAFKRAFQIAKDDGSVNIYIPDGNYILKETIQIYRNTNVQASRNATIKKNHFGVMFANTLPTESYAGYEGGKKGDPTVKNNGNIFFDGGTYDNDGTSGSTFSLINARNFEFKNMNFLDIVDSHAFDLAGIADIILFNNNFLGFEYRRIGDVEPSGYVLKENKELNAYSECIQIDFSAHQAFPYQQAGHDGTACQRVRVDKCFFGKSDRFPAWNRAFGCHNIYIPTYDWLHNPDGTATGNAYNFLASKTNDIYFINNVIEGNGTLKYDYDQNDPESFIIQQVRLLSMDNVIVMNNKLRNVKGGISIDVDQTPKTLLNAEKKRDFNTTGTASYPKSGVMPAKVTYLDSKGDMQTILFSNSTADYDMNKITTHTHDGITYTIIWCKTTKLVARYGWENALIMNNELTNTTSGIFDYKQVTATTTNSTVLNKLIIGDINDALGNTLIKVGTEIYYNTETNPRNVTAVVGTPSTDINGNVIEISPYMITVFPAFTTMPTSGKAIKIKGSPSKSASTPIYVRGKTEPYAKITVNADGSWTTTKAGVQQPRGKKCIIYGNIIEGLAQKSVYAQYDDTIRDGDSMTYIKAVSTDRLTLTLNAVTHYNMKVGKNIYWGKDLNTPYQIMSIDTTGKKVTIFPALTSSAVVNDEIHSREPIPAGQSGGASLVNAIQGGYIHHMLVQKNVVRNVPRAVYISGSTWVNIQGNSFSEINETSAITMDGGDYCNIIGNNFSDLNDQAIEMRNNNYFNIANNQILNHNQGEIYVSPYPESNYTYNPLDTPTIIVKGDGVSEGKYGTITGNMLYHANDNPVKIGIQSDDKTMFVKMSNNAFPSQFTTRQDNRSDVGLDYGFRGNDADTLQGKSIEGLGEIFVQSVEKGVANGIATLDSSGKVPQAQLPASIGSAGGFKTISIPNGENINATTLANTLKLKSNGGITFDAQEGNTLEIGFDDSFLQQIPAINLEIDGLSDNQDVLFEQVNTLNIWQTEMIGTTIPNIDAKDEAQDSSIENLELWKDEINTNVIPSIDSKNVEQDSEIENIKIWKDEIDTNVIPNIDSKNAEQDSSIEELQTHQEALESWKSVIDTNVIPNINNINNEQDDKIVELNDNHQSLESKVYGIENNEIPNIVSKNNSQDNAILELQAKMVTQVTKLGVIASEGNPKLVDIIIPHTMDFNRRPIEVLKFVQGIDNNVMTLTSFDNWDSTDFKSDNQLEFDGAMKLKTSYLEDMNEIGALGGGKRFSVSLDISKFKKLESFTITHREVL